MISLAGSPDSPLPLGSPPAGVIGGAWRNRKRAGIKNTEEATSTILPVVRTLVERPLSETTSALTDTLEGTKKSISSYTICGVGKLLLWGTTLGNRPSSDGKYCSLFKLCLPGVRRRNAVELGGGQH